MTNSLFLRLAQEVLRNSLDRTLQFCCLLKSYILIPSVYLPQYAFFKPLQEALIEPILLGEVSVKVINKAKQLSVLLSLKSTTVVHWSNIL